MREQRRGNLMRAQGAKARRREALAIRPKSRRRRRRSSERRSRRGEKNHDSERAGTRDQCSCESRSLQAAIREHKERAIGLRSNPARAKSRAARRRSSGRWNQRDLKIHRCKATRSLEIVSAQARAMNRVSRTRASAQVCAPVRVIVSTCANT
jgi:hypothetical protein